MACACCFSIGPAKCWSEPPLDAAAIVQYWQLNGGANSINRVDVFNAGVWSSFPVTLTPPANFRCCNGRATWITDERVMFEDNDTGQLGFFTMDITTGAWAVRMFPASGVGINDRDRSAPYLVGNGGDGYYVSMRTGFPGVTDHLSVVPAAPNMITNVVLDNTITTIGPVLDGSVGGPLDYSPVPADAGIVTVTEDYILWDKIGQRLLHLDFVAQTLREIIFDHANRLYSLSPVLLNIPAGVITGPINRPDLAKPMFVREGDWFGQANGFVGGVHGPATIKLAQLSTGNTIDLNITEQANHPGPGTPANIRWGQQLLGLPEDLTVDQGLAVPIYCAADGGTIEWRDVVTNQVVNPNLLINCPEV